MGQRLSSSERASELREILLKRPSASDDDKGNEVRRCWREGREREGERERESTKGLPHKNSVCAKKPHAGRSDYDEID